MPAVRLLQYALVTAIICCALGCGASNNKGRIEGKWKIVSDDPQLRDTVLAFGDDGSVTMERPTTPEAPPSGDKRSEPIGWRYKLLAGDGADFYALPPDATVRAGLFPAPNGVVRATIQIESTTGGKYEERAMILTAADRMLKLTWLR
ncbi:hypothetical protein [Frigoriglobus tundricola]|uniref:Lipocalin-like domain-containing protein n=1 Tax=Frigoriglobus tundricola TaxID=2774151 RepID=A0A6M5Z251_9BACT|nr:hypothetical protein [Frigoriglobus tundricola]QJW99650.1 hypothetical protein FTUN_7269 [Frigoriglobus tundricola]